MTASGLPPPPPRGGPSTAGCLRSLPPPLTLTLPPSPSPSPSPPHLTLTLPHTPSGEFPWRWTLCGWSLAFKNPQILVIPDTHEDARFAQNLKVTKPPHVRFYCGAPLVASNGHRLGTLCFADVKPRVWDAGVNGGVGGRCGEGSR